MATEVFLPSPLCRDVERELYPTYGSEAMEIARNIVATANSIATAVGIDVESVAARLLLTVQHLPPPVASKGSIEEVDSPMGPRK